MAIRNIVRLRFRLHYDLHGVIQLVSPLYFSLLPGCSSSGSGVGLVVGGGVIVVVVVVSVVVVVVDGVSAKCSRSSSCFSSTLSVVVLSGSSITV